MPGVAKHLASFASLLGAGRPQNMAPLGCKAADRVLRGGLARGALHEIFAGDASAAAAGFAASLARRVDGRLLWIVQDFSALEHGALSPTGLAEIGFDPASVLLLRAAHAEDALRAGADALSCAALGVVIVEIPGNPKVLDLVASRRLVLGAQNKGVTALLLRHDAQAEPSAAQTRWLIRAAPSRDTDDWGSPRFDASLTRNRQGETGRWMMEWCCDDGAFRESFRPAPSHSGAVVPTPADGPASPAQMRRAG
jgi:protein ImuA